jgi:hypothetical protein
MRFKVYSVLQDILESPKYSTAVIMQTAVELIMTLVVCIFFANTKLVTTHAVMANTAA